MKESIGSVWIFAICMTFIVLFTGYIAIAVNYSKAFRIKSHIVSEIEQNKGWDGLGNKIELYLTEQGYTASGTCPNLAGVNPECIKNSVSESDNVCNACIYEMSVAESVAMDDFNGEKSYYKVVTFFKFDLPIVNTLLTFQVSGDTGVVKNP